MVTGSSDMESSCAYDTDTSWEPRKEYFEAHRFNLYEDDVLKTLCSDELKRYNIMYQSPCLCFRSQLVSLIEIIKATHQLSRTTYHLAIYLLDFLMDSKDLDVNKLDLSAFVCLMIAAKMEDNEYLVPQFDEINKHTGNAYTLADYCDMEQKALVAFDFQLLRPTTATFIEHFAVSFVTLDDYFRYNLLCHNLIINEYLNSNSFAMLPEYKTYSEMLSKLTEMLFAMVDITVQFVSLTNERPSILAASCICAVRQMCNILPAWTPYLVKVTNYTESTVLPLVPMLTMIYETNGPKEMPNTNAATDSGIDIFFETNLSSNIGYENNLQTTQDISGHVLPPIKTILINECSDVDVDVDVDADDEIENSPPCKRLKDDMCQNLFD